MAADRYLEFDSDFFSKHTTLDHYLNKGAFGTVYGPIPWHNMQVAIKQVMLAQGKATDDFKKGMEEKQQIWTSLEHKNIMRIHSVDLTRLPKAMFIVMEYAAGGTVTETLRSLGHGNKLPIHIVTNWAKQIAEGMLYLHKRDIVHRDLKSSNILLKEPHNACNTDTMVTLKIADFDDIKEHDHTITTSFMGTCAYMAPEVLKEERFSKGSDVWSFGVVIWEMLSGDIPHKNLDSATIFNKASEGEPNELHIEQSFPKDYKLLLRGCWKLKSKERLSIHEISSALQRIDVNRVPADMAATEDQELLEIHVIEINYQFLVENLKGSHLIDLLHEQNCITDEMFLTSNHTDNYVNNEALLKWMGDIAFKKENGRTILECLRKSEQNLIADLLGKVGGVFIKSMISTKLLVGTQLLTETIEAFKEKKMMVIEKLNNPQGLSLGVELSSVSDIVIAPYCRLEANEIVIWFWCQSKNGQINLKNIYDSKILHQELTTLFKEFVNDSVSSESEILVPSTIFLGDFTKKDTIHGLAVLNQEAFIVRQLYPYIEVYDSRTFQFRRRIEVDGMNNPENVVSCSVNNCLYTFNWQYEEQNHAILKIDPNNGKLFTTWLIEGRGGRLSVASDTHVILNKSLEAKLLEYTSDGDFIRTVDLVPMYTGIDGAQHAVKLNNDQFVVCHGGVDDPLSRVCLVSLARSYGLERTCEVDSIVNLFGAEQGKSMNRLMGPTYLSVNKEGSILVAYASHQFVLLTCNLDEPQIIVSEEHGLEKSWRTCFDESTGQWFLADYKRVMVCRVTDKQVERKLYYLISP